MSIEDISNEVERRFNIYKSPKSFLVSIVVKTFLPTHNNNDSKGIFHWVGSHSISKRNLNGIWFE